MHKVRSDDFGYHKRYYCKYKVSIRRVPPSFVTLISLTELAELSGHVLVEAGLLLEVITQHRPEVIVSLFS